ncbi:hypothetical protein HMPREF9098_1120 [Kingella denitrificans ATCC 33394]|uniref:Uncharacterized protein n=1 Tax=Kingella denitrificans ATCC 33394 TaxID=888741 RepID=F0EZ36_9NEIS|nr:hypothetical protein HMPREF9098_1120 [Kingella denitrificans ATCC 33394]
MLYDMRTATPLQSRPPHGFARIGRRGVTRYFDDDAALEAHGAAIEKSCYF